MTDSNLRHGHLEWLHGMAFRGSDPQGLSVTVDGDSAAGPSPMVLLLLAIGGCSGADIVSILVKKQVTLTRFSMAVTGRRRSDHPRRYEELTLVFRLAGEGLTEAKARHAVDLSVQKYCSVMLSLNPDIPVRTEIIIEEP